MFRRCFMVIKFRYGYRDRFFIGHAVIKENDPPAVLMVCQAGTVIIENGKGRIASLLCGQKYGFFLYFENIQDVIFENRLTKLDDTLVICCGSLAYRIFRAFFPALYQENRCGFPFSVG